MRLADIRALNRAEIEQALTMADAFVAMRSAFRAISSRNAIAPIRINLPLEDQEANCLVMPVYVPGYPFYIVKTVSLNRRNIAQGMPLIHAAIQVFCANTGVLRALLDGEYITGLRTGAGSAVATDILASPDASTLAVFGTGPQAWFQIMGILEVRAIKQIMIYGRDPAKTSAFAERVRAHFKLRTSVESNLNKLKQADIICTATTSQSPLFRSTDIKRGVHINAIGAYKPDMIEIAGTVLRESLVVVDSREAALKEAGDIVKAVLDGTVSKPHCGLELGDLLLGQEVPASNFTVFKSVGNAVQDFYCVALLWPHIQGNH